MDVTTILAVICSAIVFLAWFALPAKFEAPVIKPALPDLGTAEMAA